MRTMTVYMIRNNIDDQPKLFAYSVIKRKASEWSEQSHYYEIFDCPEDDWNGYDDGDVIDMDECATSKAGALQNYRVTCRSKINQYLSYIQDQIDNVKRLDRINTGE